MYCMYYALNDLVIATRRDRFVLPSCIVITPLKFLVSMTTINVDLLDYKDRSLLSLSLRVHCSEFSATFILFQVAFTYLFPRDVPVTNSDSMFVI